MRRLTILAVTAIIMTLALPAFANHPPTTDSGTDIPNLGNSMNQEEFWESYFDGPGFSVECTKYENHNGSVPSQYEAAVVKSGSDFVRVYTDPPSQLLGPPNPNAQHPDRRFEAPFSWVMKCDIDEVEQPEPVEYFVGGVCMVDQDGVFSPRATLDSSTRELPFFLNGVNVGVVASGILAQFGVNNWTNGEASGSFEISDERCAPETTTTTTTPTVEEVTTTTAPTTPTLVVVDPPVAPPTDAPTTTTTPLAELPFTGPENLVPAVLGALALMGLGVRMIRSGRSDES